MPIHSFSKLGITLKALLFSALALPVLSTQLFAQAVVTTLGPNEIEVEYSGGSEVISLPFIVRNNGTTVQDNVSVQGMLVGDGNVTIDSVEREPGIVAGEMVWYIGDGGGDTSIYLYDQKELQPREIVNLTTEDSRFVDFWTCGIWAMDVHPQNFAYYAILGSAPKADWDGCDDAWGNWDRWLVQINPFTGEFIVLTQVSYYIRDMRILPDGTFVTVGGDGSKYGAPANPVKGGIYSLSASDGTMTLLVDPPGNRPNANITYRASDNTLWYYTTENGAGQEFLVFNVSDWSYVGHDVSRNDDQDGSIVHIEGDTFFLVDDGAFTVVSNTTEYKVTYIDCMEPECEVRGLIAAGHHDNGSDCGTPSSNFECTVNRIVPWNGWFFYVDLEVGQLAPGTHEFKVQVGDEVAIYTITVVAPDLTVNVTPQGERYEGGDEIEFSAIVENLGNSGADSVVLTFTYPDNLTYNSTDFSGCSDNGTEVSCNLSTLPAESAIEGTFNFTAGANGAAETTAEVESSTSEPNLENNAQTQRNVIGPAQDVAISIETTAATNPGDAVSVNLLLVNNGPDTANSIDITLSWPKDWSAETVPSGCNKATLIMTCDRDTLAAGGSETLEVVLIAPADAGLSELVATVEAASPPDLSLANNTASVEVTVRGPTIIASLGASTPGSDATLEDNQAILQLTLTHGGQTTQAVAIRSLSIAPDVELDGVQGTITVDLFNDANGNGVLDEDEEIIGTAGLSAEEGTATVTFDSPFVLEGEATANIGIIVVGIAVLGTDVATNSTSDFPIAGFIPFALAGAALTRRKSRNLIMATIISIGFVGCGELLAALDALDILEAEATVTLEITEASAALQEDATVESEVLGLPIQSSTITVQQ